MNMMFYYICAVYTVASIVAFLAGTIVNTVKTKRALKAKENEHEEEAEKPE